MRKDRVAGTVQRGTHNLAKSIPGINRFLPGIHSCECGESFSGLNAYERHRAESRKAEREAA